MIGSIRNFEKNYFLPKIKVKHLAQGQTSKHDRLAQMVVLGMISIFSLSFSFFEIIKNL